MSKIKIQTQEIALILKELSSDKYKGNASIGTKIKKIQEAFKKETDRFGELAKELSKKSYHITKSKSNLSGSEIG